jgi:hypothetical protein
MSTSELLQNASDSQYLFWREKYRAIERPHNYTSMLRSIPGSLKITLQAKLENLFPGSILAVHLHTIFPPKLEKMKTQRFEAVKELERSHAYLIRKGKRRTVRPSWFSCHKEDASQHYSKKIQMLNEGIEICKESQVVVTEFFKIIGCFPFRSCFCDISIKKYLPRFLSSLLGLKSTH